MVLTTLSMTSSQQPKKSSLSFFLKGKMSPLLRKSWLVGRKKNLMTHSLAYGNAASPSMKRWEYTAYCSMSLITKSSTTQREKMKKRSTLAARGFDNVRSNPALNLAPFGRWTALKRRRLAQR